MLFSVSLYTGSLGRFTGKTNKMLKTIVKVSHVAFSIGRTEILADINLKVNKGDVVTIIGPNGAGKSTLLRIILGLIKPTSGEALIREKTTIGYMPQKLTLDPSLPITVDYFLRLSSQKIKLSVEDALDSVGATRLQNASMHDLSGGEFQRVLLARAIMSLPDLLVLDEPVQGVDISGQQALYELLAQIRKRWGCAMVIVSHDMHMVFSASDQVVCLNKHVCCQGRPEAIIKDPEYKSLFGPVVAPYKHDHSHDHDHGKGGHHHA
jgi:zinc transport system ATP-binding protein